MSQLRMCKYILFVVLFVGAACAWPDRAAAQSAIKIDDHGAVVQLPDQINFRAKFSSSAAIEEVVLEYGVEKRTCGEVSGKAFPKFRAGKSVEINWIWDMLESGSEPPGAVFWHRWHVRDAAGNTATSERLTTKWFDSVHPWRSLSEGQLTLHWYNAPDGFGQDLLATASQALARLAKTTAITPQSPINIYIYANNDHMRDAIFYEPSWTGGAAFPENNIVIIGIHPSQIDWGRRTIAHEITHLLVGQMSFSCVQNVPTWLNEGIAVYGEGGLDERQAMMLRFGIGSNQLSPLRALGSGFSQHPAQANLAYAQSYSAVNYLIERHGTERLLALFAALRQGVSIEHALNQVYGFGLEAFESEWRRAIGAAPASAPPAAAAAAATLVPTYPPVVAAPAGTTRPPLTPTATAAALAATPTEVAPATAEPAGGVAMSEAPAVPPQSRNLGLLLAGGMLLLFGLALSSWAGWRLSRVEF